MCMECLLESIDEIIKRSDEDLLSLLDGQVMDPQYTLDTINDYEDALYDIFQDDLQYFIDNIGEFDSITSYFIVRHNRALSEDPFSGWVTEANINMNVKYLFDTIPRYYNSVDKSLIIKAIDDVSFITKEKFFNQTTLPTLDYMGGWSERLGELMKVPNHNAITGKVMEGMAEGKSIKWLQDELLELPQFNRTRARTTALTESLRADSYAANEAYITNPVVITYKWKHTGSRKNKPRANHVALDGTVIPKGSFFQVSSTEVARFPRDEMLSAGESVNCHCIFSAGTDPDITLVSAKEKETMRLTAIEKQNTDWLKSATDASITRINDLIESTLSKYTSFMPVADMASAKLFAKEKLGIDSASYTGLDIDTINDINEKMFDYMQEFPELKGYITKIQSVKAKGYSAKSIIKVNADNTGTEKILRISKTYWDDTAVLADNYIENVNAKWFPRGSTYLDTINHEMTHMLENYIFERDTGLLNNFTVKLWNDNFSKLQFRTIAAEIVDTALSGIGISEFLTKATAVNSISTYAMTNASETLAEAFVKAINNPNDEVSNAILQRLLLVMRGE